MFIENYGESQKMEYFTDGVKSIVINLKYCSVEVNNESSTFRLFIIEPCKRRKCRKCWRL